MMAEETKADKFHRLALGRKLGAVKSIELMQNLIRSDYESTEAERISIVGELEAAVADLRTAWKIPAPVGAMKTATALRALEAEHKGRAPIDISDRAVIREALALLIAGDTRDGIKKLRSVVLGWVPPAWQEGNPE